MAYSGWISSNRRTRLAGAGFALVIGLMLILIATTAFHGEWVVSRMQTAVAEHSKKLHLANTMYAAARERSFNAVTLILSSNQAEIDSLLRRHRELASKYMAAREELIVMPLNGEERNLLDLQFNLARVTAPALNDALDLYLMGDTDQARELLLRQVLPNQNVLLEALSQQADMQHKAMQKLLSQVQKSQEQHRMILGGMSAGTLILAIVIALAVVRRMSKTEEFAFAKNMLESVTEAVVAVDARQRISYLNPAAERLIGIASGEAVGKPVGEIIVLTPPERDGHPFKLRTRSGQNVDVEYAASDIHEQGRHLGTLWVIHDVTYTLNMATQLAHQASHDPLTGLPNRRAFELAIDETLKTGKHQLQSHVVGFLDLDMFKAVNDNCGHVAGDELLRQIGGLFQQQMRTSDMIARVGGDEFGFLLRGCSLDDAKSVAQGLLDAIRDYRFNWDGRSFNLGASIGLKHIDAHTESTAVAIQQADSACYTSKKNGRDRISIYSSEDAEQQGRNDEAAWGAKIKTALDEDGFVLHGQPIVLLDNTPPSDSRKVEILLRMRDADGSLIMPASFMPMAERLDLMPDIDRWVIRHALAWAATDAGKGFNHIAINLAGASIGDAKLLKFVADQIKTSGVNPSVLCFEIPESAAIANFNKTAQCIQVLRGMGCKFALDEFGSGAASFAYVKNLGVDYLKIAGNYVRDMQQDLFHYAMTEAIHRVGKAMGIKTMTAYVESEATLQKLQDLGIDLAQGYKIAPPQALDSLK
ncbi:MAG: EAL domain-containing protein [Betaproteobacteria bacterium]|nr:EAL domain-containing protein [Betaproteobacteria bacterium]